MWLTTLAFAALPPDVWKFPPRHLILRLTTIPLNGKRAPLLMTPPWRVSIAFDETHRMLKKIICPGLLGVVLSSAHWITPVTLPVQSNTNGALIVAVFRTDGVVVPFARYANEKWTNPWHSPRPDDQAYEMETIADLPKPWYESFVKTPGEWQLLSPAGGELTVRTSKNVEVCSHCQQVWGLLSDYPNATPAGKNECVLTLGVALNEKRPARPMERLTDASPDWKQLLVLIAPQFERAEIAALTHEGAGLYASQVPSAEDRAKMPLSMQKLYRNQLTDDGQTLLYFEASREYQKPRDAHDPSCENISMFGGWALRDAKGNLALLDSQLAPTNCDRKQVGLAFPFAILTLDGKTFAIIEEDSYEGESYIILEIRKDSIHRVLETYAGSC